jgi:hypothetical protein
VTTPEEYEAVDRAAVQEVLRAHPWWPFYTAPVVRVGTWLILRLTRNRRARWRDSDV